MKRLKLVIGSINYNILRLNDVTDGVFGDEEPLYVLAGEWSGRNKLTMYETERSLEDVVRHDSAVTLEVKPGDTGHLHLWCSQCHRHHLLLHHRCQQEAEERPHHPLPQSHPQGYQGGQLHVYTQTRGSNTCILHCALELGKTVSDNESLFELSLI